MDALIEQPEQLCLLPPQQPNADLPSSSELPAEPDGDRFDWFADAAVIVERQMSIAVYRNRRDHVVIRSEPQDSDDNDVFIFLSKPEAVKALIAALQRELKEWHHG